MRVRDFPDQNYKAVFNQANMTTIRTLYDNTKPIRRLQFPEILDISMGTKCLGDCPYCYAASSTNGVLYSDCTNKVMDWFGSLSINERPFQVAIGGGGEPTLHPEFISVIRAFRGLDIIPNYTTNGMHMTKALAHATKIYCGGVAVSCHEHLMPHWVRAVELLYDYGIKPSIHIIIGDRRGSVGRFWGIYNRFKELVSTFVLLPYQSLGRAPAQDFTEAEFDHLFETLTDLVPSNVAFGAGFYTHLLTRPELCKALDVSLYEPEIVSGYVKLEGAGIKILKSSYEPW